MELKLKPQNECMFDEISLGKIMLRLDLGEGRIKNSRMFKVWEGGGEYNVARGLCRCFGLKTAVVTAFADTVVSYDLNYRPSLWKDIGDSKRLKKLIKK